MSTDYDRICQEIFPLMSAWGRAIEYSQPYAEHLNRLLRIAHEDPVTMHEAVTTAIGLNQMRAEYTLSPEYNAEAVGKLDPFLAGKTREETYDVFIKRKERVRELMQTLGLDYPT